VGLFCLQIFLDYFFIFSWDIENIFIKNPEKLGEISIGRMSPITAFLFMLISLSLLGNSKKSINVLKYISGILTLFVCLISSVLLIGYLYKAPLLYGSHIIPVALPTAICFLFLSVTMLRISDLQYWTFNLLKKNSIEIQLLKSFLPIIISLIILQGFLVTNYSIHTSNPTLSIAFILLIVISGTTFIVLKVSSGLGTKLQKAEQAIKESEERFHALFDKAPLGYQSLDFDGNFIEVNQQWLDTLGYNKDEVIGRWFGDFLSPTYQDGFRKRFPIFKAQGKIHSEFEMVHKNGKKLFIAFDGKVGYDLDGAFKQTHCILQDITESKRIQEELKSNEEKLRFYTDNAPMAVIEWDSGFNVTRWSGESEKIFGWNSSEVLGKNIKELNIIYEPDIPIVNSTMEKLTQGELKQVVTNNRNYKKDGSVIICNWYNTDLKNQKGEMLSVLSQVIDITQRKQAELELINAKEKAEESERLKSAFLANMSHEIRTPMNGILGFTELLREPNLTSDEQQDYIQTIQISGARMLNTINNIVDVSKIESGLTKVDINETNLNEKIEFTYKFFKPEVEIKGLNFIFKNGLLSKEAIIETDNEKVYAILTNLVKNAIKYTYDGSIEFGYEKKGEFLEFFVKDTGVGIPQKQHLMIFERFRQGSESQNRGYEGSGLGLSIAKSYVEMLGGNIWVESEEGKGSIFYFTIPYNAVSEDNYTIENDVSGKDKEVQVKNLKILIVEDDEISHSLLTRMLQKNSKEVLHAITGVDAVETCRNNPDLDLVLMDIRMPEMDGNEATRQIRRINKKVIIIAQTAYAFAGDKELAIEAGCNDYITKPINQSQLKEVIRSIFTVRQ